MCGVACGNKPKPQSVSWVNRYTTQAFLISRGAPRSPRYSPCLNMKIVQHHSYERLCCVCYACSGDSHGQELGTVSATMCLCLYAVNTNAVATTMRRRKRDHEQDRCDCILNYRNICAQRGMNQEFSAPPTSLCHRPAL